MSAQRNVRHFKLRTHIDHTRSYWARRIARARRQQRQVKETFNG
jgi:hypothetical protein